MSTPTTSPRVLNGDHCRCTACGHYFNSTHAFDKHRTGKVGTPDRRCMTEEEMRAKGMTLNSTGWWITGAAPTGLFAATTLD